MHSRRNFLFGIAALGSTPAMAQFKRVEGALPSAGEADATFRMEVSVVNVFATVRDSEGRIVNNLNQEDFEIFDEGNPAEIRYFSRQSDLPLTLGLLVDTSISQQAVLEEERTASKQFLDQVLRPEQDEAFLIRFDVDVELLQDLTQSKEKLETAIGKLKTPDRTLRRRFQSADETVASPFVIPFQIGVRLPLPGTRGRRIPPGGRRPGGGGGTRSPGAAGIGTALYDAVFLAADEVLKDRPGRKAIILLSDGVDYGSKVSKQDAVEAAHRSESIVYSILYADDRGGRLFGRNRDGKDVLRSLSGETGGAMFEVSGEKGLTGAYTRLQEELRNQYSIGLAPALTSGPAFRKLEVRTRNKSLKVQSRSGYFPKPG